MGGGDEDAGGEFELRLERLDARDAREVREGVRYGVSVGVGNPAWIAAEYSSSVSHSLVAILFLKLKAPPQAVIQ